jgi:hypothetical protein
LCHEQRKLVLSCSRQGGQLHSRDFRTDGRSQFLDLRTRFQ